MGYDPDACVSVQGSLWWGRLAWVRVRHPRLEVVGDGIVREQEGDLAKPQQVLEHVLRHQPCNDRVGGGERGGAHTWPLIERLLDRRGLEPARAPGDDQLHRARHGVVRAHAIHERQLQLLAHGLERLPRRHVVHTSEQQVDWRLAVDPARREALAQLGAVLVRCDIHVVHLEHRVRAQLGAVVAHGHRLVPAGLLRAEEHLIHVCELDRVVIVDDHLAYATARKHLAHANAHTADADDRDRKVPDALVVLDDAHRLERHQPRVRICVDNLGTHRVHLLAPHATRTRGG
mmetsp:Transcript_18546/g.47721  ORF Transcript_18546/g.47721 Transcript_18546/m.47721 type:complete len:289 (+) Transcript_18546:331-1197(+)